MREKQDILHDAEILYNFHSECSDDPIKADIILAAGSHDLRVAYHAAELFKKGYAPLIVCSGGFGKVTGGIWNSPESVVYANRCVELGVPKECIVIEKEAKNSGDNFVLSRDVLINLNIYPKTGIIVCKPYMAKRAWATGTKQWGEVEWSVRTPHISFEDYPGEETPLDRMINLMVGDLQRLEVYAEKGFQVPVTVPDEIWEIYNRLAEDGYDQFVIK